MAKVKLVTFQIRTTFPYSFPIEFLPDDPAGTAFYAIQRPSGSRVKIK